MKRWFITFTILLILTGCGRQTANVDLPGWAPKNPSDEFIKAAKVLQSFPSKAVKDARFYKALVPAWEFFGALSDEQIADFTTNKKIVIPYSALTEKQRRTLDNYFNVYRQTMKDAPPSSDNCSDELADLYRFGANQDLSNVDILIDVRASGIVRFACVIHKQDGSISNPLPLTGLGTMR